MVESRNASYLWLDSVYAFEQTKSILRERLLTETYFSNLQQHSEGHIKTTPRGEAGAGETCSKSLAAACKLSQVTVWSALAI